MQPLKCSNAGPPRAGDPVHYTGGSYGPDLYTLLDDKIAGVYHLLKICSALKAGIMY